MNETSIMQPNEFLPKIINKKIEPQKRISYSLKRKAKSFSKKKNINTHEDLKKIKKRFESEDPSETFKFY